MEPVPQLELDVRGLACPLPVLRANKMLKTMVAGALLRVVATDPGSVQDMPKFCGQTGHELVSWQQQDECYVFLIRKGS